MYQNDGKCIKILSENENFWNTVLDNETKTAKKNESAFEDRAPICVDDVVNKL